MKTLMSLRKPLLASLIFIAAMQSCKNANSKKLLGEWERSVFTTDSKYSLTSAYAFTDDGKGHFTDRMVVTDALNGNSSRTLSYPFKWEVKENAKGQCVEIKYFQGDIKELTGKDREFQEQKAREAIARESGSTDLMYYRIQDNKMLWHGESDTATYTMIKKNLD